MTRRSAVTILALACLASGCDTLTGSSNIDYRVTGTASRVSITYETEDGTAQVASATLPWSFARRARVEDFVYLSAQISQGTGTVTVSILKGGDVWKTTTSSGFASIATVSGIVD